MLEGFENIVGNLPTGGIIDWYNDGVSTYTLAPSVLHVTQGNYSGLFSSNTSGSNYASILAGSVFGGSTLDLSAYGITAISLDVYVQTIPHDGIIEVAIFSGSDTIAADTTPSGTGAFTLLADVTGFDLSNVSIAIGAQGGDAGSVIFYIDNMRGIQ